MTNPCFFKRPNVCICGDSTVVNHYTILPTFKYCKTTNLAVSGDTFDLNIIRWLALPLELRQSFDYVIIQIGLNSMFVLAYQNYVDTIKLTVNPNCRVIGVCMTPTRAAISVEDYNRWLALNAAIRGEGTTPITGLYGSVSSHLAIMGDANDNLLPAYDGGDHRHPNLAGNAVNCEEIAKVMPTSA